MDATVCNAPATSPAFACASAISDHAPALGSNAWNPVDWTSATRRKAPVTSPVSDIARAIRQTASPFSWQDATVRRAPATSPSRTCVSAMMPNAKSLNPPPVSVAARNAPGPSPARASTRMSGSSS